MNYRLLRGAAGAAAMLLTAGLSTAQETDAADPGVEVTREAEDLSRIVLDGAAAPPSYLDTALVVTNQTSVGSRVFCAAFNHRGAGIGRAWTFVPGDGVRVMLASDISDGAPFIGRMDCYSGGNVFGTGFVIGAVFSDTQVSNDNGRGSHIRVQAAVNH